METSVDKTELHRLRAKAGGIRRRLSENISSEEQTKAERHLFETENAIRLLLKEKPSI